MVGQPGTRVCGSRMVNRRLSLGPREANTGATRRTDLDQRGGPVFLVRVKTRVHFRGGGTLADRGWKKKILKKRGGELGSTVAVASADESTNEPKRAAVTKQSLDARTRGKTFQVAKKKNELMITGAL